MEPKAAVEADADDDYMGDLSHFLPPSPSSPSRSLGVRKQPPAPAAAQSKRAKGLPWKERRRQERQRIQQEEDARTLAGMAEAIPESNVGFKLLKQMGLRSRSAPPPAKPKTQEEEERERKREEDMVVELRARKSTQWRGRRVVWDYRKAEAALAQLENREVEPPAPDGEEKENGEEDEEEVITEEGLQIILDKLRDQHLYCLYCGCKYESREALANECPGPNEEDH